MNRNTRIKELESIMNESWRVKGKYFVKTIVSDSEEVIFSIFENETTDLLIDFAVPYSDDVKSLITVLETELRDTYIMDFTKRMKPRPVKAVNNILDFEQWIIEAKFYCEWIAIFRTVRKNFEEKLSA
ncbi:hypothetical protein [Clostridium butyricum]|uniref:hypothetical protein n=1 Tax=Clostridium butyricum TaxID=1492 RepID=UPI00374F651A